jgi:hypothetical protein
MSSSSESEALPAPSGRYHVGRTSYDWVDAQRAEIYSPDSQGRRELFVWVWYPAAPGADAAPAAYLPDPWAPTGQFLGLDATGLQSHAVADAAIATDQANLPVLGVNHTYETAVTVFADGRSGSGSAPPSVSTRPPTWPRLPTGSGGSPPTRMGP